MHSFGIDQMPVYRPDHGKPHVGKFAGLVRVSTDKQEVENQMHQISQYLNGGSHSIKWFKEEGVTGSRQFKDRPVLQEAMDYCRKNDATLIITSLSRLSRTNWEACKFFDEQIRNLRFKMVILDNPSLDHKTIGFFAQQAYNEKEMLRERTLASMNRIKAEIAEKGLYISKAKNIIKKLGRDKKTLKKATTNSIKTRVLKADEFAEKTLPLILNLLDKGMSYRAIAREFNRLGMPTQKDNKKFEWYASTISNIVKRNLKGPKQ